MPPRHQTLPPAQTASAREALASFYCQLCSKGYSRMNEYEAHLSSYDHAHKQRLRDMKAMVRDPTAAARARRQEARAEGAAISIKLGGAEAAAAASSAGATAAAAGGAGAGFKKGGFKKAGFKAAFAPVAGAPAASAPAPTPAAAPAAAGVGSGRGETKSEVGAGPEKKKRTGARSELVESDTEDEGYEVYDPRKPTD